MSRRGEWKRVLDAEVARWSRMSCAQLVHAVPEEKTYRVQVGAKHFQVEVTLAENTADYAHVIISVDDGTLPWSIFPATSGFIKKWE